MTPAAPRRRRAPTVTLTAPAADSTVGTTARFAADATSGRPISRVEFWVDSKRVVSDTRTPYTAMVDLTSVHTGTHTVTARAFDSTGQAASTAVLVRVSRTARGRVRAAAVSSGGRATKLTSAAAGAGATQLAGQGPSHRMLVVTLTRCDDRKGKVVDRARMRANDHGQLSTTRAREGLCVLASVAALVATSAACALAASPSACRHARSTSPSRIEVRRTAPPSRPAGGAVLHRLAGPARSSPGARAQPSPQPPSVARLVGRQRRGQ